MSKLKEAYFPLGDSPSFDERKKIKEHHPDVIVEPFGGVRCFLGGHGNDGSCVAAVFTGEKRPPREGEWYLSGAEITAYKAKANLSTAYHIAKLAVVSVQTKRSVEIQTLLD